MDYLHYMNFESEAFALFVYPLATFAYFHHYLTTIVFSWPDVYCLIFSFVTRFILISVFTRVIVMKGECIGFGDKATYPIIATLSMSLYIAYLGYYIWTDNDTLFSQVCVKSEMVSLPLLFMYASRNYKRIRLLK